jgi:hypothetical protein
VPGIRGEVPIIPPEAFHHRLAVFVYPAAH